jgi:hypothetical protein
MTASTMKHPDFCAHKRQQLEVFNHIRQTCMQPEEKDQPWEQRQRIDHHGFGVPAQNKCPQKEQTYSEPNDRINMCQRDLPMWSQQQIVLEETKSNSVQQNHQLPCSKSWNNTESMPWPIFGIWNQLDENRAMAGVNSSHRAYDFIPDHT